MRDDWYKNPKWETKREYILRRDHYQCQESKRYGKLVEAEVVHHIFPRDEFSIYEYEDWNLISISLNMHNRFHDRETNELTEAGAELLRRTARRNNIPIPDRYRADRTKNGKHRRRIRMA